MIQNEQTSFDSVEQPEIQDDIEQNNEVAFADIEKTSEECKVQRTKTPAVKVLNKPGSGLPAAFVAK